MSQEQSGGAYNTAIPTILLILISQQANLVEHIVKIFYRSK